MSNILITLYSLNATTITNLFCMVNSYPLNLPEISGLNQENEEGLVSFSCTFGFDDIAHGFIDYSNYNALEEQQFKLCQYCGYAKKESDKNILQSELFNDKIKKYNASDIRLKEIF